MNAPIPQLVKLCRDCRHFRGNTQFRVLAFGFKTRNYYEFGRCGVAPHNPGCRNSTDMFVIGSAESTVVRFRDLKYADLCRLHGPCTPAAKLFEAKSSRVPA